MACSKGKHKGKKKPKGNAPKPQVIRVKRKKKA